jgi:hypothetical protein
MTFAVGQKWSCPGSTGQGEAYLVIGALLSFESGEVIACCVVTGSAQRHPDGSESRITIPFLPITAHALGETVTTLIGSADVPQDFQTQFEAWRTDPRGLSYFTVPFEGRLDLMIARQMAEIVGERRGA